VAEFRSTLASPTLRGVTCKVDFESTQANIGYFDPPRAPDARQVSSIQSTHYLVWNIGMCVIV
jgi:hypothetical protein